MKHDRQVFEITTIAPQVAIHYYESNTQFTQIAIALSVGSTYHRHGLAHFYEHMVFHRSQAYPAKDSYSQWVSSKGGGINAVTKPFSTTYFVEIPTQYVQEAWAGLYSMLFEPVFTTEDIVLERTIISNERDQRKWYPGETELGHYLMTQWMDAQLISKQQLFGTDADLGEITTTTLENFSQTYRQCRIDVIIVGPQQIPAIADNLQNLDFTPKSFATHYTPPYWQRDDFHSYECADIDTPIYFSGAIYPLPTDQDRVVLHFILDYLTEFNNGPLHRWLRHEKGWTYGIQYNRTSFHNNEVVLIEIPLQKLAYVDAVRSEITEKINAALADPQLLQAELERQRSGRVFLYQKTEDIIADALSDISNYGRVISEAAYTSTLDLCADPQYVQSIYDQYFNSTTRREFLALPLYAPTEV